MANDLNRCEFIGRLGADAEVRYTTAGKAVASFSIACGSSWKDKSGEKQESTEWINCTAFDKLAEIIAEYLRKGSQVYVSGRLKTDKYEKDGQTRYSTKVVIDTMQMLGSKPADEHQSAAPEPRKTPAAKPAAAPVPKGNFDDFDSDIPF